MRVQSLSGTKHTRTHTHAHVYTCTRAHTCACTHVHTHAHTRTHTLSEEQREQRSSLFMTEATEHTQGRVWASLWVRGTLQSFLISLLSCFQPLE